MKICLISLFTLLSIHLRAQPEDVLSIEFQSLSRNYFEKVLITSDSLVKRINKNRGSEEETETRIISKKEWKSLIKDLENMDFGQIQKLESPTKKRTYDGARHSTIKITTTQAIYEHLFDDENPNRALDHLMKCIIQIRDKQ